MIKLKTSHLISLKDLSKEEILQLLSFARKIKKKHHLNVLKDKIIALLFSKSSTRTRLSFEVGIRQLGGSSIYLNVQELQLGRGETIEDTAKIFSRFVNGVIIRTYNHKDIITFAENSSIPVINGLTDFLHPCQILSDLLTISEFKDIDNSLNICYIGDANNVANSWLEAAVILGFNINFVVPEEYNFKKEIFDHIGYKCNNLPENINIEHKFNPSVLSKVDVIYTDVWVSMGQEKERKKRLKVFKKYKINRELIKRCRSDVKIMHCLPAHRGEEIESEVIDSPNSIVFDQAENRLHLQKALLVMLLKDKI